MTGRANSKAWIIWSTGVAVYLLAVFHRTSFGVAGLAATHRFGVDAAELSTFTVLQVGVYAGMQIPTGLLVDRFGPRKVLATAAIFLGLGQTIFALAHSYPVGLLARGVLGFGDALTFVSVLRLVAAHFPARWYALVTTFTSALGYVGNLAATVPLALLLAGPGWTPTFLVAGIATACYAVVVLLWVRDRPAGVLAPEPVAVSGRALFGQVRGAWRTPGTRLGFWVHFCTMSGPNVLTLLWGMPFLVGAEHFGKGAASALLMVFVFGSMIGGPTLGGVITRRPGMRMPLVAGYLIGAAVVWALLLGWPGTMPVPLLVVCFAFLSLGGPVSVIGFALARDYNPVRRIGTATGVVNVGGFVATTIGALLVGIMLQLTVSLPATTGYRIAFCALVAVVALGVWRMLVWWRRARAALLAAQARGEEVPVRLRRRRWDGADPLPAVA
ncbi:MAG: MFS transporter [Sciscionella sp.]